MNFILFLYTTNSLFIFSRVSGSSEVKISFMGLLTLQNIKGDLRLDIFIKYWIYWPLNIKKKKKTLLTVLLMSLDWAADNIHTTLHKS